MPTIVRIPANSVHQARRQKSGVKIGFCRICTCKNLNTSKLVSFKNVNFCRFQHRLSDIKVRFAEDFRSYPWKLLRDSFDKIWPASRSRHRWELHNIMKKFQLASFNYRRSILQLPLNGYRVSDNNVDSTRVILLQLKNSRINAPIGFCKFTIKSLLQHFMILFQEIFFNSFACFLYISTR